MLLDKYQFKEYSTAYPAAFEGERSRIVAALDAIVAIEHIGSTSVPSLGGKGVIDLYVVVAESIGLASAVLQQLGYEYRPHASTPDRLFHKAILVDSIGNPQMFQVHLSRPDCPDFRRDVAFRDWLRSHPEDRERYEVAKRLAAEEAQGDGGVYKQLKSDVMRQISEKISNADFS